MSRPRSILLGLAPILLLLASSGCSDEKLETFPTTGIVKKNGKPIGGASVMLFPQGGSQQFQEIVPPRAMTNPDGTFTLSTYRTNDGAPAGAYKVTVTWNEVPSGFRKAKSPHDFADDDPESEQVVGADVPDRLRGQYGDAATTPLMATVSEGPTELPPIELK